MNNNLTMQANIGGVNLGYLTDYLFFFPNGNQDANWQGATKGYIGDVAIDGLQPSQRTSGSVPYAGTLYTNAPTHGAWQNILNQNLTQANGVTNEGARISGLKIDLINAFNQINTLPPTPGFESVSSISLDGLNTENGINEVFVINITSGLSFTSKINITGDPGDIYILRWDTDPTLPGYQGQVKPSNGGAIVPLGGLKATNFINVAGDINASGGGTNPLPPYPQGPRYDDGQGDLIINGENFSGGGFFTGYWLTTGKPTTLDPESGLYIGETSSLSNGIFVGGWYTLTTKFSMTSGTSCVYVSPPLLDEPAIEIIKYVSPDNGTTWLDANTAPGPTILPGTDPQFKYVIKNIGNIMFVDIEVTDDVYGLIGTLPALDVGETFEWINTEMWELGQHTNIATVTAIYNDITYTDSDPANYIGSQASINLIKYVSDDNGITWYDANSPIGPIIPFGTNPQFRFVVTNNGTVALTDVSVIDSDFGVVILVASLAVGETIEEIIVGTWKPGQHFNNATATGTYDNQTFTDTDPAYYFGADQPSINIIKYLSVNEGVTWLQANNSPGPMLPEGVSPQFRFVVTNNGNAPLTNINVNDDVYGFVGSIPFLAVGDSYEWIVEG